jgi:AcrR family transcriptional regulator
VPSASRSSDAVRDRRLRTKREAPRRERLLRELEEIFLREGFSSLTTDQLCKRLRCSKSTLYSVAGSREQINQAVVRYFFAHSSAEIEADLSAASDPASRIVTYLEGVGRAMNRNSPAFYEDMVTYAPTAAIYRLNSDAAAARVQAMIEEGVREGSFRAADAALASLTVAHLMDGVQSGEVLRATGLSAGAAFAELGELLVHGLAVRKRQP